MKIINFNKHRGPRRPFAQPLVIPADPPTPKKKALLIGINYSDPKKAMFKRLSGLKNYGRDTNGQLLGPHQDVMKMKDLLLSKYNYAPEDIVMMMDDGQNLLLHPTRENIIREITNLVQDAHPGDKFFFHYSGHVEQIRNKDNTEEDGMDECLLPMDAKGKDKDDETLMIRDNELKKHLVDALPVGAQLVAVFDSCHSASLLDLEHFRCNRVYVPWISKGRRKSDSIWNANVRRNAVEGEIAASSKAIYQTKRISETLVKTKKSSIEQVAGRQSVQTRKLSMKSNFQTQTPGNWSAGGLSPLNMQMCDSPVAIFPCDGRCREHAHEDGTLIGPQVISLGSCKDSQLSWEDRDGNSMTKALVQILQTDPNPSLKDLMVKVSHELHKSALNTHKSVKRYKKGMREYHKNGGKVPSMTGLDMDNFQDAQLASQKPLDMAATQWNP